MSAKLHHVGSGQHRVVVVDDVLGDLAPILTLARALAPFPPAGNYYPGHRHVIAADEPANAYVSALMQAVAPYIAGAFGRERFRVAEASFSMVTTPPAALTGPQRAPHFDTTDPDHLAVLHYLNVPGGGGTAFYRHRATRTEMVTKANVDRFVSTAMAESRQLDPDSGYVTGDHLHYEMLFAVPARPGRLLIYSGALLHSGLIPDSVPLTPDPREGRLTGNFFVQLQ